MFQYLLLFFVANAVVCENESRRPNFVLILTDDQDVIMDGMVPMVNVNKFIANEGVTFANSFTTSPICCPSRASILTGTYVHNHYTVNNSLSGGCYSRTWKVKEKHTFATSLQDAGYHTLYAGKYMNEYGVPKAGGPETVPPGWDEWHGLVGNSVYYNYTISHNGQPTYYDDVYLTDLIRNISISYVQNRTEDEPFLMVLAPPAPHQPFTPAPRHRGAFANHTMKKYPNFNISVDDKHWLLSMPPSPLPEETLPQLEEVFRSRWESLLAVDEMVADVIETLDTQLLLDNTYVIYTSDNGYHIGQYSQMYDKRQPYETDIRVPFLIRGPGLNKSTVNHQPIINIDIAPTILQLAGVEVQNNMDGQAIDFEQESLGERFMLIEYYGEGKKSTVDESCPWYYDADNLSECYPQYDCKCQDSKNNTFACVRHFDQNIDFKYCSFDKFFTEIYDLLADPYEVFNQIHETLPAIRRFYSDKLSSLMDCKGSKKCEAIVKSHFKQAFNIIKGKVCPYMKNDNIVNYDFDDRFCITNKIKMPRLDRRRRKKNRRKTLRNLNVNL